MLLELGTGLLQGDSVQQDWGEARDMARCTGGLLESSEQMITTFWQQAHSVPKSGFAQQKFETSCMW